MENIYHFNIIEKAIGYIREYHDGQPTLDQIAAHVHMSKFHFQRLFKKWAGVSPKEFLQYLTVERAKEALQNGKSTLDTAYDVGLSGNGRLHDLFLKIEACTPGEFRNRGKGVQIKVGEIDTSFGVAAIAETEKGICRLSFDSFSVFLDTLKEEYSYAEFTEELGENGKLAQQYFRNWKIPKKKIGLDLHGTPFQIQVWKALLQIPSSSLASYQNIASSLKNQGAVRAVGTAIGKNPIAYLIPCHRVIKNNGKMGEYRWNSERKMAINGYEGIHLNPSH
ncbi:MAG: methylated-DNA--[protein]-cysteine S-methyltransferase [Aurantibacter sp.]